MVRPAALLGALAAAAAVIAAAATTTATVLPAGGDPPPTAVAAFASPTNLVSASVAVAAAAAAANAAATAAAPVAATRPPPHRLSREAAAATDPITCLTLVEFRADIADTGRRMEAAGVPTADVAAFERTLLRRYKAYVVRVEGDRFCVRRDAFADYIVDVYLDALDGKLRT